MRHRLASLGLFFIIGITLTGCAGGFRGDAAMATQVPLDEPLTEEQAYQQYVAQAAQLAGQQQANSTAGRIAPEVLWENQSVKRDRVATEIQPPVRPEPEPAITPAAAPQPERSVWEETVPIAQAAAINHPEPKVDRQALVNQLVGHLAAGEGGKVGRALHTAAVIAIESDRELPQTVLAGLSTDERRRVQQFHMVVRDLMSSLSSGEQVDVAALSNRLEQGFGTPSANHTASIGIGEMQLCTSVRGFGVYEPFAKDVFLAGRVNKMIVYLELEGFTSELDTNNDHVVRLSQELELYDDGGLIVWRHTPQAIEDRARRERRDFFTVQLVELPARLTVGKFYLKARVIDEATGHRAERSLPIEVVADYGLAVQGGRNLPLGG